MNKTFTDLHDQALLMGEHNEQMREAYEAVVRERDALAAKLGCVNWLVHKAIEPRHSGGYKVSASGINSLLYALGSPSEYSLNHIKAQVEEETIGRAEEETGYVLESVSRKYAKQAGTIND